jgi:ribosome-binding protein aMBF1 (putative translation factor)
MIVCDLCGQSKECLQKEIEGKEYDICADCWNPLAEKLKGKGRKTKEGETVFLPPLPKKSEPQESKPVPGEPPKIWGGLPRRQ